MQLLITIVAIALYLISAAQILKRLRRISSGEGETGKLTLLVTWAVAITLHITILYQQVLTPDGLNLAFFNALSTVALLMAALVLISALNRPVENLGLLLLPFAALCVAASQAVPGESMVSAAHGRSIQVHVFVSLLAHSMLTIAVLQALLLSAQDRRLHTHQPGGLVRALPPLQWMEELLFRIITLGLVLLTLALATGFFYLEDLFAQRVVHHTVLSIAAWIVFAILLWGRWQFGWRGQRAIRWTLGGFFFLMLAYFGSKLVVELILPAG